MLREYEFTLITKGDLSEGDRKKVLESYESIMTLEGGTILTNKDWGLKKLAYPIKKSFKGHYMHYDFVGEPSSLAEMERLMRIDDNVLRHMFVRLETKGEVKDMDIEERKRALAVEDAKAREALESPKDN